MRSVQPRFVSEIGYSVDAHAIGEAMERASLARRIGVDHEAIEDALCVRSVQLGCLLLKATSTSDDPLVDFRDHPRRRRP